MSLEQILETIRAFDGVAELAPEIGSDYPEISWDDQFFYYSPSGGIPMNTQPYATIVTKDYPDDAASHLDEVSRWRLNIHVGADKFAELTGETTKEFAASDIAARDFSAVDVFLPHPVYGSLGWVAIVNPGERTTDTALELLRDAHEDARRRADRREGSAG